ncbi:MAG: UvrD-helicase domain-containing protein [Deltaproteobacteria bacterium]|nr:UvrD-helicase domain-containing protein [Deltaproteobacteria bacterium]
MSTMNAEQKRAVAHGAGPLLVLAGAGSGKTTVITRRIARLIETGVPPRAILAMTFTNKAAGEMLERIVRLSGERAAEATIGTFHAFGLRVLRAEARSAGIPDGRFAIFDQADQAGVVRELLRTLRGERRYDVWAILSRISKARNAFVSPEEFEARPGDEYDEITRDIYPRYMKALRGFRAFDFDDLVCEVVRVFKRKPEVLKRWVDRYQYILVDEYQDTNIAQFELVRLLGEEHRNVCVVGDDDQAIYGWRGADVRNILEFDQHFPKTKVIKLEKNYRSCGNVLAIANAVIHASTGKRHDKTLQATRAQGGLAQMIVAEDPDVEASFIATEARRLIDIEHLRPKDIAVLFRSAQQSEAIETAFKQHTIPFRLVGGTQFYERKEVKDLIAYLRVALSRRDEISLRRIINYPARGIGDAALDRLTSYALVNDLTLWKAVQRAESIPGLSPPAVAGCKALSAVIETASKRLDGKEASSDVARTLAAAVGLEADIAAGSGSNAIAARRKGNLDAFLNVIQRHDAKGRGKDDLREFLQVLSLQTETDQEDPGNVATLTTIHGSKGLEFDTVFLAGAEEGLLPHARTLDAKATDVDPQDVEEERRLFYVAVTRAMNRLYICRAKHRAMRGKPQPRTPSRFLEPIGADLVEEKQIKTDPAVTMKGNLEGIAGLLAALEKL